ncbi:TPA: ImmA/IrrE family metallo-endopeptidase [Enterobacter hormaechei subsp. steigerwaltii]|nr:ImmA/IrrE family metallo-endopeptidase [Enterobacter hormaechei subsp. steigerwaltii]HBK4820874.1 ImmA/IrrE family metallo-endopeptidase [Enterobacter hormaechei subsp. steigerwaltii]
MAIQWLSGKHLADALPVDCIQIAESLGIKVQGAPLKDEFQGALFITPGVTAIIYNENIKEDGRKNFTIAHEIGHYCLHSDREEVQCRLEDVGAFSLTPHGKEIEKEANEFAACLLMPEKDVQQQLLDKNLDIKLVLELALRYGTTVTATACQMVHVSDIPLAVVMLNDDNSTKWCLRNSHFRDFFIKKGTHINLPEHLPEEQSPTHQDIWLPSPVKSVWSLKASSLDMEEYKQRIYMISGSKPA